MAEENHTIRLLAEIRKEMSETREEMRDGFRTAQQERDELRAKLGEASAERAALRQRMVEGEVRIATELLAVTGAIDETKGLVRQQSTIKMVVTDHERRLRKLEGD